MSATLLAAAYLIYNLGIIGGTAAPDFEWDPPSIGAEAVDHYEVWIDYEDGASWVVDTVDLAPNLPVEPEMCRAFTVKVRGVAADGEEGEFSEPSERHWLSGDLNGDGVTGVPDFVMVIPLLREGAPFGNFYCIVRTIGSETASLPYEPPQPSARYRARYDPILEAEFGPENR